eukprot:jgi/Bigna1/130171/aug1.10_g4879
MPGRRRRRKKNGSKTTESQQKGAIRGNAPRVTLDESKVYEVAIVGAGPCSLACASALLESTVQSSLQYDHTAKNRKGKLKSPLRKEDICIIDASGESWMARWKSQFTMLKVPRLRSIMTHHPDSFSEDSLIEYAILKKNFSNLESCGEAINGLFKEGSSRRLRRNAKRTVSRIRPVNNATRYRFIRPSTSLYNDFCDSIVDKLQLENMVIKGTVTDVQTCCKDNDNEETTDVSEDSKTILRVTLKSGASVLARSVVLAVGNTCIPRIPLWARPCRNSADAAVHCVNTGKIQPSAAGLCEHTWEIAPKGMKYISNKVRGRRVLVVGGGLTAVQSSQMCANAGARRVVMMSRRTIAQRDFDVPVSWFGATSNAEMCAFWQTEDAETRYSIVKSVRGKPTVPNIVWREFVSDIETKRCIHLMEGFHVTEASWNASAKCWNVVHQESPSSDGPSVEEAKSRTMEFDYILLATGAVMSAKEHPLLGKIYAHSKPEGDVNGFPVLSEELRWNETDMQNLFVTGGYAALQLGPVAATLAGARKGALILRDAIFSQIKRSK